MSNFLRLVLSLSRNQKKSKHCSVRTEKLHKIKLKKEKKNWKFFIFQVLVFFIGYQFHSKYIKVRNKDLFSYLWSNTYLTHLDFTSFLRIG